MAEPTSNCSKRWGHCMKDPRCADTACPEHPGHSRVVPEGRTDLTGQRFGRLLVVAFAGVSRNRQSIWLVRCNCGIQREVIAGSLISGQTQSCGCLEDENRHQNLRAIAERRRTHGMTDTRTYRSWTSMIQRCHNQKHNAYSNYGGRGIVVCERWRASFASFLEDMGPRPQGTSLDRFPDQSGNYEPGNCRWATSEQQQNNKRTNRLLELDGRTKTVTQWAREVGLSSPETISRRLRDGWSVERAVRTPSPRPGGVE
jgi:hypothetical protein